MKRTLFFLLCFVTFLNVFALNPHIISLSRPNISYIFEKYEISLKLDKQYKNPYDPSLIDVYAIFTNNNNESYRVNAFYYEGYSLGRSSNSSNATETFTREKDQDSWRIRFAPQTLGKWRCTIYVIDHQLSNEFVNSPNGEISPSEDHSGIILMGDSQSFVFQCVSKKKDVNGFISKANDRFLKRQVYSNRKQAFQYESFFPVGPNYAYYERPISGDPINGFHWHPYQGIYEYQNVINNRAGGNINYMRVWLNRCPMLSLQGPSIYNNDTINYFDNTINQICSRELDTIIDMARDSDINIMLCMFMSQEFDSVDNVWDIKWGDNPYREIIDNPIEFFTNPKAIQITKNFLRYVVARWGYATNIMCWELFNEIDLMHDSNIQSAYLNWQGMISNEIRNNDPFDHLISTSIGGTNINNWFSDCDFYNIHRYVSICDAKKSSDLPYLLFKERPENDQKPFFYGEFGLDNVLCDYISFHGTDTTFNKKDLQDKCRMIDPYGFHIHNTLWATFFSGSMGPASFWWWSKYLFNKNPNVSFERYSLFKPILAFSKKMPILSASFKGYTTVDNQESSLYYPNGLEVYYMTNNSLDTICGWAQDCAYSYISLRSRQDSIAVNTHIGSYIYDVFTTYNTNGYLQNLNENLKPTPSPDINGTRSNEIQLSVNGVPAYTNYKIEWYDAETGKRLLESGNPVECTAYVSPFGILSFDFPTCIRDLSKDTIYNTYGDAVFVAHVDCDRANWMLDELQSSPYQNVKGEIVCDQSTKQVFYNTIDNKINSIWWNQATNSWDRSNLNNAASSVKGNLAISHDGNRVFYINNNGDINSICYNQITHMWVYDGMNNATNGNAKGPLTVLPNNQVFYVTTSGSLNNVWPDASGVWHHSALNNAAASNVGNYLASNSQNEIFYVTSDHKLKAIKYNYLTSSWENKNLNDAANTGVLGPISITPNGEVFFRTTNYKMNSIKFNTATNSWGRSLLNNTVCNITHDLSNNASILQSDATGKVFYITNNNQTECIYNDNGIWVRFPVGYSSNTVRALASNYDGHVFCITENIKGVKEIKNYLYYFPCSSHNNGNISVSEQEINFEDIDKLDAGIISPKILSTNNTSDNIKLYPNPTKDIITIYSTELIESASVYNSLGIVVDALKNHTKTFSIDLSKYPTGIYYVKITFSNGKVTSRKIVKTN